MINNEQPTEEKIIESFHKRRKIRMWITFITLFLLVFVTVLAFPSWELFGFRKLQWAPFFYLLMFILLISIGVFWRCPSCNGLLGDLFNTRHCPKCGIKFYKD